MKVTCVACGAVFKVDETKLKGKKARFTCKKCGHKQIIYPPGQSPDETGTTQNTGRPTAVTMTSVEITPEQGAEQVKEWYIAHSGEKMGPWTLDEVREWLFTSKPIGSILVWKNGFEGWKSIKEVDIFAPMLAELEEKRKRRRTHQQQAVKPASSTSQSSRTRTRSVPDLKSLISANEPVDTAKKERPSIDLSELVQKEVKQPETEAEAPAKKKKKRRPRLPSKGVAEYRPPEKKKINWMPIVFPPAILLVIFIIALTLAYYKVVHIPYFENLPVIGKHFAEKKISYEELHKNYLEMIRINEEKIRLEAEKERKMKEEERRRLAEKERKERIARRKRLLARMKQAKRRKGTHLAKLEFDFDSGNDTLETKGPALGSRSKHSRLKPITPQEISRMVRKHWNEIVQCLEYSRETYKENLKGEMEVAWTISFRGTVRNARVLTGKFRHSFLADCIVERISNWKFRKTSGNVQVRYPFTIK